MALRDRSFRQPANERPNDEFVDGGRKFVYRLGVPCFRSCFGYGYALLHLQFYFAAFEACPGDADDRIGTKLRHVL